MNDVLIDNTKERRQNPLEPAALGYASMDDDQERADEVFEGKERGRRGGGGKLSRSETVTVRLDPRLNYLTELAARAQRRTKSSFIEWAIDHALEAVPVPGTSPTRTISDLISSLWDVEEADRLARLAFEAPFLLTHDEQLVWKLIESNGALWRGAYNLSGEWTWNAIEKSLIWARLREHYEKFKAVADGLLTRSELPTWQQTKPSAFETDLDDDVPF